MPFVNYHRPCFFPEIVIDDKETQCKRYRYEHMMMPYEMMTPCDKLKSLPDASQHLKPGVSFEFLDDIAHAICDNQAASRLQEARRQRFDSIDECLLAG